MENSVTSMNKTLYSKTRGVDYHEESTWTFYFEDFLRENNGDTSSCSGHGSPSLVSDAASLVAVNKFTQNRRVAEFYLNQSCEKLSPIKRKSTSGALFDDALEDTATSPDRCLNRLDLNQKPEDDDITGV